MSYQVILVILLFLLILSSILARYLISEKIQDYIMEHTECDGNTRDGLIENVRESINTGLVAINVILICAGILIALIANAG